MSQILLTDAETEAQEVKHTLMAQEKSPALLQVMVRVKLFAPERLQGGNLESSQVSGYSHQSDITECPLLTQRWSSLKDGFVPTNINSDLIINQNTYLLVIGS